MNRFVAAAEIDTVVLYLFGLDPIKKAQATINF
jgi:hypothetical protein